MSFESTRDFARELDKQDPLGTYRNQFHFPINEDGSRRIYLTGNSLGLQPIAAREQVIAILEMWQTLGVAGHFSGAQPWMEFCATLNHQMARVVGARESEVVLMNGLSVNLHLLLATFYRPSGNRTKILVERDVFPSDRYAIESQIAWRGLGPADVLIVAAPSAGEPLFQTDDMLRLIRKSDSELSLILLGGVNYLTGQLLDIEAITRAGHDAGCVVGFDLAHAAGNVELELHDWGVDFAAWCTYKYLNAGPGAPAAVFVHEKHHGNARLPALKGWWGQETHDRFNMQDEYRPAKGAVAFQVSNPAMLSMAPLKASLDLFGEIGMHALRLKSQTLTAYLEYLLKELCADGTQIITPTDADARGAQLSVRVSGGRLIFDRLREAGVWCDWREPETIRMAPVPLYNSFEDVFDAVSILADALSKEHLA